MHAVVHKIVSIMSYVPDDPFSEHEFEGMGCFEALDTLDASEREYWGSCADFAERPSGKRFRQLTTTAQEHADAFRGYVENAQEQDMTVPELSTQLLNTLLEKDARRVAFLNVLLQEDTLKASKLKIAFVGDEEVLDPEELIQAKLEVGGFVTARFEEFLVADTTLFVNNIERLPSAKLLRLGHEASHHLLDVGKIALGAGIALAVARGFRRNS